MAGEFDDLGGRLEAISEELADLAIERLKESHRRRRQRAAGRRAPPHAARRACREAVEILREPDDLDLGVADPVERRVAAPQLLRGRGWGGR